MIAHYEQELRGYPFHYNFYLLLFCFFVLSSNLNLLPLSMYPYYMLPEIPQPHPVSHYRDE